MQNRTSGTRTTLSLNTKTVPVITGEGLVARLPLSQIGNSGKTTVCHGKTFDGVQVNSAAFHTNGQSIVIAPNNQFSVGISMPQADFELLARTYLEAKGAKISAPSVTKA